ncbi:WAP four-disulfide core domain protein 8 [Sorex fumeus]|uniref:WAP four-disulfide core domain protein 8 n=1 Tax=Sorex fumeus TaxID=62283 RepID=UPI0024ADB005|nr:WAP four-disulfide core domain protein 8 [Sorex fumeus]
MSELDRSITTAKDEMRKNPVGRTQKRSYFDSQSISQKVLSNNLLVSSKPKVWGKIYDLGDIVNFPSLRKSPGIWRKAAKMSRRARISWKTIAFLLYFLLFLEKTPAKLSRKLREKPGVCPMDREYCKHKVQNLCYNDFDCPDHQKCCYFYCGMKCLDPGQEPCLQSLDTGNGTKNELRWYFDSNNKLCKEFVYGGSFGNNNNFFSKEDCEAFCSLVLKEGQCPIFPVKKREICPDLCRSDIECPLLKKCCETLCGFSCVMAWTVKEGHCPPKPKICPQINKPKCLQDTDCPMSEKCCSYCGLRCLDLKK